MIIVRNSQASDPNNNVVSIVDFTTDEEVKYQDKLKHDQEVLQKQEETKKQQQDDQKKEEQRKEEQRKQDELKKQKPAEKQPEQTVKKEEKPVEPAKPVLVDELATDPNATTVAQSLKDTDYLKTVITTYLGSDQKSEAFKQASKVLQSIADVNTKDTAIDSDWDKLLDKAIVGLKTAGVSDQDITSTLHLDAARIQAAANKAQNAR
jgi:hypothetical protein